jgi:hypothetical protein
MRRFWLGGILALALGGCVSAPQYVERDGGDYYYDEPRREVIVDYVPDYFAYSAYYSALWPVYCPWWDAFCDSFHYGITFFPHRYFGFGFGYGFAYSPWYGSWWDSYYDWGWWQNHHSNAYTAYSRFGSVQNEQRAVAMLSRDTAPNYAASLRAAAQADSVSAAQGATLHTRSTPLRATRDEPVWQSRAVNVRAPRDAYYGVPVRRSVDVDRADGGTVGPRRSPDVGTDRSPRHVTEFDNAAHATRPGASPRAWARGEPLPARSRVRDDAYSAPRQFESYQGSPRQGGSYQDSPRFIPREREPASMPVPARSAPTAHSAPVVSAPSAPTVSAPASTPPARSSRSGDDH